MNKHWLFDDATLPFAWKAVAIGMGLVLGAASLLLDDPTPYVPRGYVQRVEVERAALCALIDDHDRPAICDFRGLDNE